MATLVTGGAGYIGSHAVWALRDAGHADVVVLDDLSTGFPWCLPPDAPLVRADVGDAGAVSDAIRSHGVDEVVHFAARIVVPDSVADPLGYYLANTVKTRSLVETCVATGVRRLVFSSTAAVYGEPGTETVPEETPTAPINPYGRSKLMSEWMLRDAAAAHGIRFAILRYFNVAGADPQGRTGQSSAAATHLIKVATQAALGRRNGLCVFGTDYPTADGSCLRDYVQVSDLARAHVAALAHLREGGESLTLNCGYGRGHSVLEVIESVRRISGVDFPVRMEGRRAGDPATLVADAWRIRETLGWVPAYDDLDAIVSQALAWEASLARRGLP